MESFCYVTGFAVFLLLFHIWRISQPCGQYHQNWGINLSGKNICESFKQLFLTYLTLMVGVFLFLKICHLLVCQTYHKYWRERARSGYPNWKVNIFWHFWHPQGTLFDCENWLRKKRGFMLAMCFVVLFIVASLTASLIDLVANANASSQEFRLKIGTSAAPLIFPLDTFDTSPWSSHHPAHLNSFMKNKKLPLDLQERIRNYYNHLWNRKNGMEDDHVLMDLPRWCDLTCGEILVHSNFLISEFWFWFFRRLRTDIYVEMNGSVIEKVLCWWWIIVLWHFWHTVWHNEKLRSLFFAIATEVLSTTLSIS